MRGGSVSEEPEMPPDGEAAVHDAVDVARPPSLGITVGLLVALLVSALVLLVTGLSLVARSDAASAVSVTAIALGGSLLVWHLRALIAGAGRRTAMISRWPWVDLVVIAGFGVTTGFALFDMLTGVFSAARIAMLTAGLVGLVAALVAFVRDTDLRDRGLFDLPRSRPLTEPEHEPEPEPVPEPEVFFDPTERADLLRPRGSWPQPRRGTTADASLWDEPEFEVEEPPRRARRATE